MTRALIEIAMRGLVRFRDKAARELFFRRLTALQELWDDTPPAPPHEVMLSKTARHRRASQYFRQHGEHYDA
jgi:hypothetical protein